MYNEEHDRPKCLPFWSLHGLGTDRDCLKLNRDNQKIQIKIGYMMKVAESYNRKLEGSFLEWAEAGRPLWGDKNYE